MAWCALATGAVGLLSSTVYTGMVATGALRFLRERRRTRAHAQPANTLPGVSLLKPLHGAEPDLEANLESFFQQQYPGLWELLFCARAAGSAGLTVARRVASRYPAVPARFLLVPEPVLPNAKVSSLVQMGESARHALWLISDSDVQVTPEYLREVMAPFADPEVGAVTCLYRGVAERGFWAKLEAVGMSVEMTGGVLASTLVERLRFLLGPTMAVRQQAVEQMGGFARLGPYCSDDFLLGSWIAGLGYKLVLSPHVIDHRILNLTFWTSMKHQVRWMRSTRFSRPKGHLGTGLTFAMPFGLLAWAAAMRLGRSRWAARLLGWTVLSRMALAALVGGAVVQDKAWPRGVLLYPLRDLMGAIFWAASYTGSTVLWRGQQYRLREHGRMEKMVP